MKYQHKITKIIVDAKKYNSTQQLQLLTEVGLVFDQVKGGQYLISHLNERGEINKQYIIDEDVFLQNYMPVKELLLD